MHSLLSFWLILLVRSWPSTRIFLVNISHTAYTVTPLFAANSNHCIFGTEWYLIWIGLTLIQNSILLASCYLVAKFWLQNSLPLASSWSCLELQCLLWKMSQQEKVLAAHPHSRQGQIPPQHHKCSIVYYLGWLKKAHYFAKEKSILHNSSQFWNNPSSADFMKMN